MSMTWRFVDTYGTYSSPKISKTKLVHWKVAGMLKSSWNRFRSAWNRLKPVEVAWNRLDAVENRRVACWEWCSNSNVAKVRRPTCDKLRCYHFNTVELNLPTFMIFCVTIPVFTKYYTFWTRNAVLHGNKHYCNESFKNGSRWKIHAEPRWRQNPKYLCA